MKVKILVMFFLLFGLTSGGIVMAHGNGQSGNSSSSMPGMDMSGSNSSSMPGMNMSGSNNSNSTSTSDSSNSMPGMDMGEGPIKETPPNLKVLGTYGVVNLLFILFGIWNKWFRRKDGLSVSTK